MDPVQEALLKMNLEDAKSGNVHDYPVMTKEEIRHFMNRNILAGIGLSKRVEPRWNMLDIDLVGDYHTFPSSKVRYNRHDLFDMVLETTIVRKALLEAGREEEFRNIDVIYSIELAEFGRRYPIAQSVVGAVASMKADGFDMEFTDYFPMPVLEQFGKCFKKVNPTHVYGADPNPFGI